MIKNKKLIIAISIIIFCLILPLTFRASARSSWIFAGDTGNPDRLRSFAVYNNKLYVGQDYGRVYRYDGGTTWTHIWTVPNNGAANVLIVWNNQLYLGGYDGWLYRYETDNQWKQLAKVSNGGGILSLAIYNGQLYAGGEDYEGSGSPVYRYQIDNNTWQQVGFFENLYMIIGLAVYHNKLYASGLGGHIWRYNSDNNWTDLGLIDNNGGIYGLINYKNQLYAGAENGCLYRYTPAPDSVNNIGYWTEVGCLPDSIYTLAIYKNKIYAGSTFDGHVWRWDNGVWFDTGMAGQGCCYNTVHALIEYNNWLWAAKVDGKIFKYNPWHYSSVNKID